LDLETQTVATLGIGFVVGFALLSALIPVINRRSRARLGASIEEYERVIAELHLEQAEDRETNRRLRHELAVSAPDHLAEIRGELEQANATVAMLQAKLDQVAAQLVERDRALREARLAIQEIRVQLEGGGGRDGEDSGSDDLPPALADGPVGD
jgi:septal ring factor EnvC (AmiA/AmiB activator)